ncbi:MAG: Gfo/Idh/MocA family oxidoreductase [Gemmataceae bacterium]|nr:Gfo/Idh/MocA family oxidoreductase [Gemmataceae bacterium]MCI0743611.1 Gfo/Idh/MocA family oxidoreductase [Gemmataceae bacterium]
MTQEPIPTTRRDFLKSSAVAGGVLAANMSLLANVHAQGTNETIRVGLIGCGGRGTGAAEQCLRGGRNVRLVALGDGFRDRAEDCRRRLRAIENIRDNVDVADDRIFVGLDAYQRVIEACDLVLLATPPGFRPIHLRAAVAARKHVFTEKPVCVDGPGARMCLQTFEEANRHRLTIVAGTQRRYQTGYVESMRRIHDGDLGTITSARCFWNQGGLWHRARTQGMTDLEWQIRNWLYFTWLSGDHIVEQHVHNIDVVNWALQNSHPIRATGLGGRQVRVQPEFGHIFDHFAIDFEYPNGVHVLSMCRQIQGCANNISESVVGTRGKWASGNYTITGERQWSFPRRQDNNPYQQEHVALLESIRGGTRINDLKNVTESSLTAVLGRTACYTGQVIEWDQMLNSQTSLMPERLSWDMELPVPPVAIPGQSRLT